MKLIKNLLLAILLTGSFFAAGQLALAPETAQAQAREAVCDSLGGCEARPGERGITGVVGTVLNILSFVAGIIAVIMIVISGLKFITSQGDSGAVSSAKNTMIYALIGIVIVLLAQIIVRFVLTTAVDGPSTPPTQTTSCVPTASRSCPS